VRFENKNILFYFEKRSSLLQRWLCSCKFKSRRLGSWCDIYLFFNDLQNNACKRKPTFQFHSLICEIQLGKPPIVDASRSVDAVRHLEQGPILRISVSAVNFSDNISSSNFGQISTQNNLYKFILLLLN
jgi:hypothetical protein